GASGEATGGRSQQPGPADQAPGRPQGEARTGRDDARPGPGGRGLRAGRTADAGRVHGLARCERTGRVPGCRDPDSPHPCRAPPRGRWRCLVTVEKYLTYRGEIKAAVGLGGPLAFVTIHPEEQPTALYRLDAGKLAMDADPLPKGGTALAADAGTLW